MGRENKCGDLIVKRNLNIIIDMYIDLFLNGHLILALQDIAEQNLEEGENLKGKKIEKSVRHKLNNDKSNIPCFNNKIPKSFWSKKK